MAAHSSPGLKDLLNPSPTPNSHSISKILVSSTSQLDVSPTQKFEELSVDGSGWSSPLSYSSSLSFPFSISLPSEMELSPNLDENLRKEKVEAESADESWSYLEENLWEEEAEAESTEENGSCHGRTHGKEILEPNMVKQLIGGRCFPPPLSCLKKVKVGKPYKYLKFDKESDSFVVNEYKIPNGDLLRASREDGRLKLYMVLSDEEE